MLIPVWAIKKKKNLRCEKTTAEGKVKLNVLQTK